METLYQKYRPMRFSDVFGQEHVITTIKNQVEQRNIAHAYLFAGPRGVGKTTIARILAKAANCESPKDGEPCENCDSCRMVSEGKTVDIFEIDAASHTGVDNIREQVIDAVRFAPAQLARKVFIIDEVHMLSTSAFNALLKTLEEPPNHAVFILATTELHKIPETIISRCQHFDFKRIPYDVMHKRLADILKKEQVEVDKEVLNEVIRLSDGCLRDAESLLNQLLAVRDGNKVTKDAAELILPETYTEQVLHLVAYLADKDLSAAINLIEELASGGARIPVFEEQLLEYLRYALLGSISGSYPETMSQDVKDRLHTQASSIGISGLQKLIQLLLNYRQNYKDDRLVQIPLELLVIDYIGEDDEKGVQKNQENQRVQKEESGNENFEAESEELPPALKEEKVENDVEQPQDQVDTSITLEQIKSNWSACQEFLKQKSGTLPVALNGSEITKVEGNTVTVSVAYALMADQVNDPRNGDVISEMFNQIVNCPLKLRAVSAAASTDEAVGDILSEFGGKEV